MLSTVSRNYRSNNKMQTSRSLFDTEITNEPDDTDTAAKAVIDKLLKVRRSLSGPEQEFGLPKINLLIEELRSLVRSTPSQREEMVLYSVERQGAISETEIAEDTKLHRSVVKQIVNALIDKELLYRVRRHVPGSDRPQFAIKSNRVKLPEVD